MTTFTPAGSTAMAGSDEKRPAVISEIFSFLYSRSWCESRLSSSGKYTRWSPANVSDASSPATVISPGSVVFHRYATPSS